MKQIILCVATISAFIAAVAFSRQSGGELKEGPQSGLMIESEGRNPWTHLRLNNDPQEFQFAVVSDRTGGHREKIFSRAIEQINLLQPEFVLSVGDLIEGYSTDRDKVIDQWKEFQNFTSRLQMPFFYAVGNHDIANNAMQKIWEEKFGRRYYHFVYKDVLFLMLCTEDPAGSSNISPEQVEFAKKVLADNKNVRWTVVALHRPIWTGNIDKNGWGDVEKLLSGRNYTVFAGHMHRYQKFIRNGMNYYQLATTGGGSRLRGVKYGEFDHIVWITMKQTGPVLANIMLDGVLPEDLKTPETNEPVVVYDRKQTHPVKGFVYLDGAAVSGVTVSFYLKTGAKTPRFTADALTEGDGSFVLSSSAAFDGAPAGDYAIAVTYDGRYTLDAKKLNLPLPEKYAKIATSELTATVKSGKNEIVIELKK